MSSDKDLQSEVSSSESQISSREVKKTDPMYENIAFKNNWAKYKIVTFDTPEHNKISTIQYTHHEFGIISAQFAKE